MSSELAVQSSAPLAFLPTTMEQALDFSAQMSKAKLLPAHLQNAPADCLRVVMQAARWQMDPFAVADKTSVIQGKLMYEGQLVSAVVNARGQLSKRLSYNFTGTGEDRTLTVSGVLKGEDEPRTITLTLAQARKINRNGQVNTNPDQQMCYIGARIWARRHTPELMLGVYADDEMPSDDAGMTNVTGTGTDDQPQPERPKVSRRGGAAAAVASAATEQTHAAPTTEQPKPVAHAKADKFTGPTVDAEIVEPAAEDAKAKEQEAKAVADQAAKEEAARKAAAEAEAKKKAEAAKQPDPVKIDTSKVPEVAPGISIDGFMGKSYPVTLTGTIKELTPKASGATCFAEMMVETENGIIPVISLDSVKKKAGGEGFDITNPAIGVDRVIEFNLTAKLRGSKAKDPATGKPLPDLTRAPALIATEIKEAEDAPSF